MYTRCKPGRVSEDAGTLFSLSMELMRSLANLLNTWIQKAVGDLAAGTAFSPSAYTVSCSSLRPLTEHDCTLTLHDRRVPYSFRRPRHFVIRASRNPPDETLAASLNMEF